MKMMVFRHQPSTLMVVRVNTTFSPSSRRLARDPSCQELPGKPRPPHLTQTTLPNRDGKEKGIMKDGDQWQRA
jgi:hypothetical protein